MSPLASWALFGALIFAFFTFLWLLSGDEHDGTEAEDKDWLDEG